MNELTVWNYENIEIRTIEKNGETWWVLADVCKILELTTPARVAERLEEDEKGVSLTHTPGGVQNMVIINESGLYSVILRSDKPQAKPFRRWVTHEVLPEIRRTGNYNAHVPASSPAPIAISNSLTTFENPEFGSIQVLEKPDGKILFCGKDVAVALKYKQPAATIRRYCKGVLQMEIFAKGSMQKMKFITEGDVFRLIEASELPSAWKIEKWIFEGILPEVRKSGNYNISQQAYEFKTLSDIANATERVVSLSNDEAKELCAFAYSRKRGFISPPPLSWFRIKETQTTFSSSSTYGSLSIEIKITFEVKGGFTYILTEKINRGIWESELLSL